MTAPVSAPPGQRELGMADELYDILLGSVRQGVDEVAELREFMARLKALQLVVERGQGARKVWFAILEAGGMKQARMTKLFGLASTTLSALVQEGRELAGLPGKRRTKMSG